MGGFGKEMHCDGEGPSSRGLKRQRLVGDEPEPEPEPEEEVSEKTQEDGERPSNRDPTRRSSVLLADVQIEEPVEEEDEEEDQEEAEEEEEEEEEETRLEQRAPMSSSIDGNLPFVTDPDVLDCSICCEALTIPVFQCENGHIACSTCCIKLGNKCPCCGAPIGYNRCRAIEKVLESVKVSCENSMYGCRKVFSYSMKQEHLKTCTFSPCSCPLAHCNFKNSSKQLSKHFSDMHKLEATCFQYDIPVFLCLRRDEKFHILQEKRDGSLFILRNEVQTLGNVITLSRIGPSVESGYFYELNARAQPTSTNLRLQSFTKSTPRLADSPPSLGFLLVPSVFCRFPGICMELCVSSRSQYYSNIHRNSGV